MELSLNIDESLYERLANRADQQGFGSIEEYSIVVLETVITELEDEERTETVEQRLEDLGYL